MNFQTRSYEKELLDDPGIPFSDIMQNMKELDFINSQLGGHRVTIAGVKKLMRDQRASLKTANAPLSILEIGCGGGDNLRAIRNFLGKGTVPLRLAGVDINPHCIEFARSRKENRDISFFVSDYRLFRPKDRPDIIFCSLFCHHFSDEQVVEILRWMKENAHAGFFLNDLHRHPFAYYSIKWLTRFFSRSYMVKNDAPLSVLRGFSRKELETFSIQSGIASVRLKWKWAFRWLLMSTNG